MKFSDQWERIEIRDYKTINVSRHIDLACKNTELDEYARRDIRC